MLAFISAGAAGGLAKPAFDWLRSRGESKEALKEAKLTDNAEFRRELIAQVNELNGRVDTMRGQIDVWQQKYFDVAAQNEILKEQVRTLKEENETLKRAVAALEDENEALKNKLDDLDP